MKKIKNKIIILLLSVSMVLSAMLYYGDVKVVKAAGTSNDVVSLAQSQIGYQEKASNAMLDDFTANAGYANYTKYHRDLGISQGQEWCAYFVLWVLRSAGISSSEYPSSGYVPTWQEYFINKGTYHARGTYTPKPGDLVIIATSEGPRGHIGIIESVDSVAFNYISGNAGAYADRVEKEWVSQSNTKVTGYCEMNYSENINHDPIGVIDSIESEGVGKIKVRGWAYDPDEPGKSIDVHVYIGGEAGTTGSERIVLATDKSRDDVNSAVGITGKHGFEATISTAKSGSVLVYIYAINSVEGNNPQIGNKSVSVIADTEAPVISNAKVTSMTSSGYVIEADITDNVGIASVQFPTWPEYKTSSGCTWYESTSVLGNHYTFVLPLSDFDNYQGLYATHIYAKDKADNTSCYALNDIGPLPLDKKATITKAGHTYEVYDSELLWTEAKDIAEKLGGHLVTINSEDENNLVTGLIQNGKKDGYWIGYSDEEEEGNFKWVTGEKTTYHNFIDGEPNNYAGLEHYVYFDTNGKWNDVKNDACMSKDVGFVVEYEPILPSSISLNKTNLSMKIGEVSTLTYKVLPENTTDKTVIWKTSNSNVATVSNGKITASGTGTAIITCTSNSGGLSVTCTVTVNPDVCTSHVFKNYVSDNNATCTSDGTKTATCDKDGCNAKDTITDIGSMKEHNYKSTDVKKATCVDDGYTTYTCEYCNDTYSVLLEKASGHINITDKAVEATCTKTGLTEGKHCRVCGMVTVEQKTVAKKGHTEVIDAGVAATCTTAGKTEGSHCAVCKKVITAQQKVPETGVHNYSTWTIKKKATVFTTGKKTHKCKVCGKTQSKTIAKLKPTIELSKTKATIKKGRSLTIKVSKLAKGDAVKTWKTSNKNIATVKNGKIKGIKKGKATITVILKSGKKATVKIIVK